MRRECICLAWSIEIGNTTIVYIWGTLDKYENSPKDPFWDTFEREDDIDV